MYIPYQGILPVVDASVYVAQGAKLIGDVMIDAESSIWFNAVLRGDMAPIRIGKRD